MDYHIGIDLGGTNIKAGIVDADGTIVYKDMIPTNAGRNYKEITADIAALVKNSIRESKIDTDSIKSIGIGVPGTCDSGSGVVICASNIGFEDVPIADELSNYFDIPVYVGNDANCAALGEFYAIDEDISDMVFITLGTGVGGGIIINKRLYTGFNGTAAEVGHMIIEGDGRQCSCGAKGCWERYASVTALIEMTKEYAETNPQSEVAKACADGISGKTAFQLAKNGDKGGQDIVERWIKNVALGIVNLINILQPQLLVIGGAISREGEYLLAPLRKYQGMNRYAGTGNGTRIVQATLGNDAGLIGSAFLGKGEN